MDRFTAALRRATRQKFAHQGVTALYYADPATVNPQIVKVIVTDRQTAVGDMKGTSMASAEIEIDSPSIEFLLEHVTPARNAFVAIRRGLVYQLDTVLPSEDISVTAKAARQRVEKIRHYQVPSEALLDAVYAAPELYLSKVANLQWMREDW